MSPGSRQLTQNNAIKTNANIGQYINANHHGYSFCCFVVVDLCCCIVKGTQYLERQHSQKYSNILNTVHYSPSQNFYWIQWKPSPTCSTLRLMALSPMCRMANTVQQLWLGSRLSFLARKKTNPPFVHNSKNIYENLLLWKWNKVFCL